MSINVKNLKHIEEINKIKIVNGSSIEIHESATVEIGENVSFHGVYLLVREGGTLKIGNNTRIFGSVIVEWFSKIIIGNNLICTNKDLLMRSHEKCSIVIGNDCLFADPSIYNSDYHGIYDPTTLERTNYPSDVIIGDNVWISLKTIILKGVKINNQSIVGAGSVVSAGEYPERSMIAGNPAKIVKSNVLWKTIPTDKY